MKALWKATPAGLVPASAEARAWFSKLKLGRDVLVEATAMRNSAFFRKWFALVHMAFDYWSDACEPMEYRGTTVLPEFERFRKDVTITAGYYHPVVNLKGEIRIEANSISFANMSEETFTKLYDATINALLQRVFNGERVAKWSEAELRGLVNQVLEFAA